MGVEVISDNILHDISKSVTQHSYLFSLFFTEIILMNS